MTVQSTDIGTKYNTQIPTLQSDADIQAALTLYHYGAETEPETLVADSIAGHLDALDSAKVNKTAVALPTSGSNLDSVSTTGFYTQTAAGAAAGSNYPSYNATKYGGELSVTSDGGVIYQDYHLTNGVINEKFWRAKFAGTWTAWASASQVGHKHNDLYLLRDDVTGETGLYGQRAITGAAKSVVVNQLNSSAAVVTDSNGDLSSSSTVSATEIGYLDGVTSNIQTQITNGLASKPTQAIGYKDTATTAIGGNATKKVVIASPNSAGTGPNIAGYTASEGDIWFW
jgi:hypothetical protein